MVPGAVAVTLASNAIRYLYAEGAADRAREFVNCARSCLVAAAVMALVRTPLGLHVPLSRLEVSAGLAFFVLMVARCAARARMTSLRRRNLAVRPALIVGTNEEAWELSTLLDDDSVFGFRACGVVGDPREYGQHPFGVPWLGEADLALDLARLLGVSQAFVARTSISACAFGRLSRSLTRAGIHVAAASGLPGVDQRRLKILPIAQMPMFSLSAMSLSKREAYLKRAIDVTLSGLGLLAAMPAMILVGLAVLIADGRPVFFRQTRVGRHGKPFTIYKFRTMGRDADIRMIDLADRNERQGPLFKLTRDPRVTRLGRLLRDSSLDELPQLLNVLQGKMSLVGPRPALPSEAALFSKELLARNGARPGMTGLWQVEAGDDPSFVLYQRLDLYYVDNWSFALDMAILVATIPTVAVRTFERLARARRSLRAEQAAAAAVPENPGGARDAVMDLDEARGARNEQAGSHDREVVAAPSVRLAVRAEAASLHGHQDPIGPQCGVGSGDW